MCSCASHGTMAHPEPPACLLAIGPCRTFRNSKIEAPLPLMSRSARLSSSSRRTVFGCTARMSAFTSRALAALTCAVPTKKISAPLRVLRSNAVVSGLATDTYSGGSGWLAGCDAVSAAAAYRRTVCRLARLWLGRCGGGLKSHSDTTCRCTRGAHAPGACSGMASRGRPARSMMCECGASDAVLRTVRHSKEQCRARCLARASDGTNLQACEGAKMLWQAGCTNLRFPAHGWDCRLSDT